MHLSRTLALSSAAVVAVGVAMPPSQASAPAAPVAAEPAASSTAPTRADDRRAPNLRVRVIKRGLDIPWDITFLPSGAMLYTQRSRLSIRYRGPKGGGDRLVRISRSGMWSSGETGLMSILAARDFRQSRHFFTCHGANAPRPSGHDVRVVKWKLKDNNRRAVRVKPIVRGLPATSGRHGGCRLRYGPEGALYIGTGDAATSRNPQNLRSGGGKVLRVKPKTGAGWPTNRWTNAQKPMKRRVFTYGHRNVQGLALRPGSGMWSVEHGPGVEDEVNRLKKGGNYGWDPDAGYDESVPMTDFSLPGKQIGARWKSGPTPATSGAVWLRGDRWGVWKGTLAVGCLEGSELRIMKFRRGNFVRMWVPDRLNGNFGRLRSPVLGPGNALYITTANGAGNDKILKVTPRR
jgi:aldose sugar dehydrogenase